MRIGVIADTHDNFEAADAATAVFEAAGADALVHCGDYISPPVVSLFSGFELHGVLGNNDGELDGLEAAFRDLGEGSALHGRFAELEFDGRRFAVLHGEDRDRIDDLAESGEYDYVCYGHHHERELRTTGETTVLNPGALRQRVPAEHRTVALVDLDADEVTFESVEY